MALFTDEQADACIIRRCESFKLDGVHQHWVISIEDEHGCAYEWKDIELTGDAVDATIKLAIKAVILTKECLMPSPTKEHVSKDDIIGQTIGE